MKEVVDRAGDYALSSLGDAAAALGAIVRRAWQHYRQRRQALATCEMLRGLDDRTLHDLGVHRSQIDSLAEELVGASERTRWHAR